jgi:hypothetical protein
MLEGPMRIAAGRCAIASPVAQANNLNQAKRSLKPSFLLNSFIALCQKGLEAPKY